VEAALTREDEVAHFLPGSPQVIAVQRGSDEAITPRLALVDVERLGDQQRP
jgi:hypothetical protein